MNTKTTDKKLEEENKRLRAELHDCINAAMAYKACCDDDTERTLVRTLRQASDFLESL